MKNQALFSSKDKSKKLKCCLLQFLFGTLRVNWKTLPFLAKKNFVKSFVKPISPVSAKFEFMHKGRLGKF